MNLKVKEVKAIRPKLDRCKCGSCVENGHRLVVVEFDKTEILKEIDALEWVPSFIELKAIGDMVAAITYFNRQVDNYCYGAKGKQTEIHTPDQDKKETLNG